MADAGKALQVGKTVLLWTFSGLGAVLMFLAGGGKLGSEVWTGMFEQWGYPGWLRILVGLAQVGGGLLLFVPRLAAYGAALLVIVMAGALTTELVNEPQFGPILPATFGVIYFLIFLARRPRAMGPLGRHSID